jgi:hypothetical protein
VGRGVGGWGRRKNVSEKIKRRDRSVFERIHQ